MWARCVIHHRVANGTEHLDSFVRKGPAQSWRKPDIHALPNHRISGSLEHAKQFPQRTALLETQNIHDPLDVRVAHLHEAQD